MTSLFKTTRTSGAAVGTGACEWAQLVNREPEAEARRGCGQGRWACVGARATEKGGV